MKEFTLTAHCIPFMYAPQIFYYRKDLFEDHSLMTKYERENNISLRPPVTLKEFNTILGGWSLGISSRSPHKESAFEFLKWTCDEQISNYSTLLGGQSAISSTYTNDELAELYPWLPLYQSIYKYTKPTVPPKLSNNVVIPQHEIDEVVCRWISKLLDYELEIQEAITETHRELEFLVHTYME